MRRRRRAEPTFPVAPGSRMARPAYPRALAYPPRAAGAPGSAPSVLRRRDWLRARTLEVAARGFNYRHWPTGHRVIGSDLDGFIKPTPAGVETAEGMCKLEVALADRYGPASADQICSANALRMLYDYR